MLRRAALSTLALFVTKAALAIQVLSPTSGTTVVPGEMVTFEIAPLPGELVTQFSVITDDGIFESSPGSLVGAAPVPLEAVGPTLFVAFATLSDGEVDFEVIELDADPGPLDSLVVSAPPTLNRIGQVVPVEVTGRFRDGVFRDLTLPETGTSYETSDEDVLGTSPDGLLQARSRGTVQLLVTSRGRARTVTVRVDVPSPPDNAIPIPDPGADRIVPSETLVELSALASSDPDGDSLRFRWAQVSGTVVILHEGGTAEPFFIAPALSEEDVLEFSLVVVDDRGAESFPDFVRVTVTP